MCEFFPIVTKMEVDVYLGEVDRCAKFDETGRNRWRIIVLQDGRGDLRLCRTEEL